jgi:hypothetical protein
MSVNGLKGYPRVREILEKVGRKRDANWFKEREEELFVRVREAKDKLEGEGKQATQSAISDLVGLSAVGLKRYPKVKNFLQDIVQQNNRRKKKV